MDSGERNAKSAEQQYEGVKWLAANLEHVEARFADLQSHEVVIWAVKKQGRVDVDDRGQGRFVSLLCASRTIHVVAT